MQLCPTMCFMNTQHNTPAARETAKVPPRHGRDLISDFEGALSENDASESAPFSRTAPTQGDGH